jgi:hypothetical protein
LGGSAAGVAALFGGWVAMVAMLRLRDSIYEQQFHCLVPDVSSAPMAQIHFRLETKLAPGTVLDVLTAFGPERATAWPNIDDQHFRVHDQGPGWAEVTEGNSIAGGIWERERYTWDGPAGHVAAETIDSNTWGPGSGWDYKLTPTARGGTEIEVKVERRGKGWKGRLIELGLAVGGARVLRSQTEQALARSAG